VTRVAQSWWLLLVLGAAILAGYLLSPVNRATERVHFDACNTSPCMTSQVLPDGELEGGDG